jgi:hypothetical protein|tara:strand:- start:2315 stop:2740 length:426 start_codon:yes stop_codon:yes gene_type:complete
MKNLILLLLLLTNILSAQVTEALYVQNLARTAISVKPLVLSESLALEAQLWADYMAKHEVFTANLENEYSENVYWFNKNGNAIVPPNFYTDASMYWMLPLNADYSTVKQVLCVDCEYLGFGKAENDTHIFIVAVYDKHFNN